MVTLMKIMPWAICAAVAAGALLAVMLRDGRGRQEEQNRALVAGGFAAWAAGTGSPYDLLAEDAVWTIAGNSLGAGTYDSKEVFLSRVIRPFNARMGERLIPSVHRLYAEGDTVIAHFDAHGMARDGTPYINSYAWILQIEAGRIVRARAFFDSIAFDDLWRRVPPGAQP